MQAFVYGMSADIPCVSKQKKVIIENAGILNRETKLAILNLVMMDIGTSAIMNSGGSNSVDINLDTIENINKEIIWHIYNIIKARIATLSVPVKGTKNRF